MQQAGRYEAVLDLVSKIWTSETPADKIINDYMRERKFIGSKDRRFISETVWNILRNRMKLEFDSGGIATARQLVMTYIKNYTTDKINEIFSGEQYAPAALSEAEIEWLAKENEDLYPDYVEAEAPKWIFAKLKDMEFWKALNQPAPADFRINVKNRDEVIESLKKEGFEVEITPYSPMGIRCQQRISLGNCLAYQGGEIEVQDEASQIATLICDVKAEHKIIDYCCGAGGKSLALGYLLNNQGCIVAHDVEPRRMEALKPRLHRLGIKNIELTDIIATSDRDYDRFIIDAPCSGSGTWRRSPDAKFRLQPQRLTALNKIQREILETGYDKTKLGGRIVYITCSVFKDENEDIIEAFLVAHPDLQLVNLRELWSKKIAAPYPCQSNEYLRLSPLQTRTDGFFMAVIEKK